MQVTMYVLLPNRPGANALKEFEGNLNPDILENLIRSVKNETCIIGFPKMKLSSTLSLKRAFQSLGLISLFDPTKADLSLLSSGLNNAENSKNFKHNNNFTYEHQTDPQLLKPQDGFYFPPRIGDENTQDNKTVGNLDDHNFSKRKHYFMYEDKLRGYSVEQWENGYNIRRNRRTLFGNLQEIKPMTTVNSRKNIFKNMNKKEYIRKKRQNRPIDQDFLDFLNTQNLPNFGLDSLRNSKNIQNPGLYAEDILHRVEININEKGTEAAAATAVALERTGSQKHFIANRPFLFFIRHELSKLIWFWGTINSPTPNYVH